MKRVLPLAALAVAGCNPRFHEAVPAPRMPLAATPANALGRLPPAGDAPRPSVEPLRTEVLENGLSVWIAPRPTPSTAVVFVNRAAGLRDARAYRGLTELMMRTLLRASEGEDGSDEDVLATDGFSPRVAIDPGGSVIEARFAPSHLDRYLPLLSRVVRRPSFRRGDLMEIRRDREELERSTRGAFGERVARWLNRALYEPDDRRSRPESGGLRGLERTRREHLVLRYRQTFAPNESAIIVVGPVDPDEVSAAASAAFGDWAGRAQPAVIEPPHYRDERERRVLVVREESARGWVELREHAPAFGDPDHAAFLVLERLLGGMFTSRLNLALREERSATYGVSAAYRASVGEGELTISTQVEQDTLLDAVSSVLRELERMRGEHGGIRRSELRRARALAREARLAELDTSRGLARALSGAFRAGREPAALSRTVDAIDALSVEELHAAAHRWIRPDRAPLVVMGGWMNLGLQVGLGGWGRVEVILPPRGRSE